MPRLNSLAKAILFGDLADVQRFIAQGADVNGLDEYGYSPLIEAILVNKLDIIKLLIELGAEVQAADPRGHTPLHWAVENNNLEVCSLLLAKGADPNAYTHASQPVLMQPLLRGQKALKELLYQHGASLNFAQDFINTKLLGHRFELHGVVDIVDTNGHFIELDYEGFFLEFTLGILAHSLQRYKNHFVAKHWQPMHRYIQMLIAALTNANHLMKYQHFSVDLSAHEQTINTYLTPELLLLPIGYEGHAITLAKYGRWLARCDRAQQDLADNVVIYQMGNRAAFNSELIKSLLYKRQSKQAIEQHLPRLLQLTPIASLPLSSQKIGNCSWANTEASIPAMLCMLQYQDKLQSGKIDLKACKDIALEFYQQWKSWDEASALHACISSFPAASPARKASKAAVLGAILFQTCNYQNPTDLKRASKIMPVLKTPGYEYVLESYLAIYYEKKRTPEGENLMHLLELSGY